VPTEEPPAEEIAADLDADLAELELPGSGETLQERQEAVRACYDLLQEQGDASRSVFLEEIYPEHSARFGSENGWWNAIRDGLRQLAERRPEIAAPSKGEHTWFWRV